MYRTSLKNQISIQELDYMRSQGMNNQQIAKQLNVSPSTISRYLPQGRKHRTILCENDKHDVIRLYQNGEQASEIAKAYDISVTTVYRIVCEAGIKSQKAIKPKKVYECPDLGADQPNSLISRQVGYFDGRLGTYYIDHVKHIAILPDTNTRMDKEALGYLIRDLMTVWKEM